MGIGLGMDAGIDPTNGSRSSCSGACVSPC